VPVNDDVAARLTADKAVLTFVAKVMTLAESEADAEASVKSSASNCSRLPKVSKASSVPQLSNCSRVAMIAP
jgi:hypothetical protein